MCCSQHIDSPCRLIHPSLDLHKQVPVGMFHSTTERRYPKSSFNLELGPSDLLGCPQLFNVLHSTSLVPGQFNLGLNRGVNSCFHASKFIFSQIGPV